MLARQMPGTALRSLSHHLDLEWMREAYRRTRKDGAVGVDGITAEDFAADLDANLRDLLDRAKSGNYRAPPVRRVEIPKDGGKTRLIGIPTFEDKVLQRAVVMLLEPIYEQEFYDFSHGFRPGRSAHSAYDSLRKELWDMRGGWVLDADVSKFFDTLDKQQLREMLRTRVVDGVVIRLIGKWLNAGVMTEGCIVHPTAGTPHGGVMTPPTQSTTSAGPVA
jgi:group II intron reverse transcriptase/maturase